MENVHDQVEYSVLQQEYGQDLADEVVSLITEVLCRSGPAVRIGQDSYPAGFSKARMWSVALIAAANQVLWAKVNAALDCLKEICERAPKTNEKRGYGLIYWRYLSPQAIPVEQITQKYHIEQAQFFRDIRGAMETLSVLLFGVGNTEDFIFYQGKGGCD